MEVRMSDSPDYLLKLLCVGEANVGKTTFLHQYIHDRFSNFRSTVGIDIFEKRITHNDKQTVLLQLWDTAGQERYRSLTQSLLRDCMGFLLVYDVTNESSFSSIEDWLTFIDSYTRVDNDLRPPIILIGNKIDLVTRRTVDTMRAQRLAKDLQITYIETSAVIGTNIPETLRLLIQLIFDFMDRSMQKYYPRQISMIKLTAEPVHRKGPASIKLISKLSRPKKSSCSCK